VRRSAGIARWPLWIGLLVLISVAGCSRGADSVIFDCGAADGITPDCRFHNPEDMVISPSGRHLIISQLASMDGHGAGSLVSLTPDDGTIHRLFPTGDATAGGTNEWGDADCPPLDPPALVPHGIDIEHRDDGRDELFVVNHGGRESVELFEVIDTGDAVSLVPRGCVAAPPDGYFNDVVGMPDGGFWVSHMYPRSGNQTWMLLRMMLTSYSPGVAYAWDPGTGLRAMPGTESKFANGIEKSADGRFMYLDSYLGNEIIKVDVEQGRRVASVDVSLPDNLTWAPNGELLAASHLSSILEMRACLSLEKGNCAGRFAIVAVDPDTMTKRVLLEHEGPPMGAATVARLYRDRLYLGTFAGDRIARVDLAVLAGGPGSTLEGGTQ
jgi:sugar lactone lactonase YvrE